MKQQAHNKPEKKKQRENLTSKPLKPQSFDKTNYEGSAPSTLCLGCGHDQISKNIVRAFYTASVNPFQVAKISGIGCSSKTPNYFLKSSRGFNTIHGRMASVATGVKIANKNLKVLGVSGDGDTGSIGLGSFLHTVRKNIPMIYIVENNGVYGLTKGQFSSTAEKDSSLKGKGANPFYTMDLCRLALSAGCGFVARSFSGDSKQMDKLLKLALEYEGFAFLDIISPCVAYENQEDFPHSFSFMKEKKWPLQEIDILSEQAPLEIDMEEGQTQKIPLSENRYLILKKLGNTEHDPTQKEKAWDILEKFSNRKETLTGLIYYKEQANFLQNKVLTESPLVQLKEREIRLSSESLKEILKKYS